MSGRVVVGMMDVFFFFFFFFFLDFEVFQGFEMQLKHALKLFFKWNLYFKLRI